jgi:hypothetical protein
MGVNSEGLFYQKPRVFVSPACSLFHSGQAPPVLPIVRTPDFVGLLISATLVTVARMREADWTKVLAWPGYRVDRHEINQVAKTLKLWVRRKRGNRKLVCSGCGRKLSDSYDSYEREVRDLPWSEYRTTVVVELYCVRCPECGIKAEKVPLLPTKAPFSKRFEDALGSSR